MERERLGVQLVRSSNKKGIRLQESKLPSELVPRPEEGHVQIGTDLKRAGVARNTVGVVPEEVLSCIPTI